MKLNDCCSFSLVLIFDSGFFRIFLYVKCFIVRILAEELNLFTVSLEGEIDVF